MGKALGRVWQPDQIKHFLHSLGARGSAQVRNAKTDIAGHVQVREQCVVLKHHANVARLRRVMLLRAADDFARQRNAAFAYPLQPRHCAQQRGFAAA